MIYSKLTINSFLELWNSNRRGIRNEELIKMKFSILNADLNLFRFLIDNGTCLDIFSSIAKIFIKVPRSVIGSSFLSFICLE